MKLGESWQELNHCSQPEKAEIRTEEAVLREPSRKAKIHLS